MNSKHFEDLTARYAYKDANHYCEIAELFPVVGRRQYRIPHAGGGTTVGRDIPANELHHISGGILGTPRYDITTNMIHLCKHAHDFCETYTADGFVLCMKAKLAKGEWDKEQMREIMRVSSVKGWLSTRKCKWDFAEELRGELV